MGNIIREKDLANIPAGKNRHTNSTGAAAVGLHVKEVLKLENVTKQYGSGGSTVTALNNINFTVHKGELTSVLGPSGSGKSTLLHIMGLLDRPTSGKVYIEGIDTTTISKTEQAQLRGRKIGFVFQAFNLIPSLTALENVELPLIISNIPKATRREKATELLKRLNLSHRLEHRPSQLSGGERQRVAIARALINDPEIILADEPTGNLDSKSGLEVLEILHNLHMEGITIIIITHEEGVVRITEKVVRIKDGKLVKTEVLV